MTDWLQKLPSIWEQASQWLFLIPALLMLAAAAAAVVLRNLIHCALCLTLSFITLGILFIALGAEFVGFVQLLVYVGAVSMLIVFAILLTPASEVTASNNPFRSFKLSSAVTAVGGGIVATLVLAGLLATIFFSPTARAVLPPAKAAVAAPAAIGANLLTQTMLPLQGTAILLTAALIGAALLAKEEKQS